VSGRNKANSGVADFDNCRCEWNWPVRLGIPFGLSPDAVAQTAKLAHEVNSRVENIGARRLQTVMEKLLEEVSFTASDHNGETVSIDAAYVRRQVADLAANADLSKFIL
jgi:ATP-dependent HslUV protease ATP-binding subunit HslU